MWWCGVSPPSNIEPWPHVKATAVLIARPGEVDVPQRIHLLARTKPTIWADLTDESRVAREVLVNAIGNIDSLLDVV